MIVTGKLFGLQSKLVAGLNPMYVALERKWSFGYWLASYLKPLFQDSLFFYHTESHELPEMVLNSVGYSF